MAVRTIWPTLEVVIPATADVGEGPVFDPRTGRLCWVDITAGTLFQKDLVTGDEVTWTTSTLLGAAAPRATEPGFAVAVRQGFGFLVDGDLVVVDAVLAESDHRMNDAKCDSRGRLWAGSLSTGGASGTGVLRRWDGGGSSMTFLDGLDLPNGIGWSPDDRWMYLVDSIAHSILVAPFDAEDGVPGEFHHLAQVDGGLPDGLSVDLDGNLWVAVWGGSELRRFSPDGALIGRVPVPVTQPSSCAFAPDGTLYITSARADLDAETLLREPESGSVFAVATGTAGVPVHPFEA